MRHGQRGYALTIAVAFSMMLLLLSSFTLTSSYNRKRASDSVGEKRMAAYYRAKAGIVDAQARIRANYLAGPGPAQFTTPAWDPPVYHLKLNPSPANPGNAPSISTAASRPAGYDVTIDIGPVVGDARNIEATGSDVI